MFVRKSKYDEVVMMLAHANSERSRLINDWNRLVSRLNKLGGWDFIKDAERSAHRPSQLSDEDIRRLLQLIHPDKHGGKQIAVEMTAKILALKSKAP